MSRCFPFPPPGYEKKPRTESIDLLNKEKHKTKKDKKDKKDREKREGKERKHKEKNKDKHGEKDKQEKDREKKKDKDRERKKDKDREKKKDKEKSRDKEGPSNEKAPEQQAGSAHEPKYVEARQKTEDGSNNNKKFVQELHQRIRNEVAGDRMVENISRIPNSERRFDGTILQNSPYSEMVQNAARFDGTSLQKRADNEMVQNPNRLDGTTSQKRTHNEMVQNSGSIQKKNENTSIMSEGKVKKNEYTSITPEGKVTGNNSLVHNTAVEFDVRSLEGQKDAIKKTERKDKSTHQVHIGKVENDANKKTEKRDKTVDQVNAEKIEKNRDKEKRKDCKDREKTKDGKDRDREKNKDGKDKHKNKDKKKEKDKVKDKKHKDNKQSADATATELHVLNSPVINDTEKQPQNKNFPPSDPEKQHQFDGNLKRKVINGFRHEVRPNKLPKVVPSPLLPLENGRKLDLQHTSPQYNPDKQVTSSSIKLPSPDSRDQKLNGTVQLPTSTVPLNAVSWAAGEIDEVAQRPARPGPFKVSPDTGTRDAAEICGGSQKIPQSQPPRVSSNSVVADAAGLKEVSHRPPKSLLPTASLNAVAGAVAGSNENPQKPPQAVPTRVSHNAMVRDAGEICEGSRRPPHPDEKYLPVILCVPKMDEWPETNDQEWLYENGCLSQKRPMIKVEANEELQVWAKAHKIESSDVLALPYVIPY